LFSVILVSLGLGCLWYLGVEDFDFILCWGFCGSDGMEVFLFFLLGLVVDELDFSFGGGDWNYLLGWLPVKC